MNLRSVPPVRDSGAQSAIKPALFLSLLPDENVRSVRVPGAFIAGSPDGQNLRASTIDPSFLYGEFCIGPFGHYALFKPLCKVTIGHARNKVPHEFGIC